MITNGYCVVSMRPGWRPPRDCNHAHSAAPGHLSPAPGLRASDAGSGPPAADNGGDNRLSTLHHGLHVRGAQVSSAELEKNDEFHFMEDNINLFHFLALDLLRILFM